MTTERTLVFYSDPAHGWLRVERVDLAQLGIAQDITGYSYQSGEYVYLEEDQDATAYIDAAEAAGWKLSWTEKVEPHNMSRIREYARYRAEEG